MLGAFTNGDVLSETWVGNPLSSSHDWISAYEMGEGVPDPYAESNQIEVLYIHLSSFPPALFPYSVPPPEPNPRSPS
jgi:hypothetical protein